LAKKPLIVWSKRSRTFKKKAGAGRGERDKEPTDVKVSDYRAKKELVFLPKKKKVPVNKEIRRTQITKPAAHKRVVRFENTITVAELAKLNGDKSFGRYEEAHRHGHDGDHQSCARLRHGNPDCRTSTAMKSKTSHLKKKKVIKKV